MHFPIVHPPVIDPTTGRGAAPRDYPAGAGLGLDSIPFDREYMILITHQE